MKTVQSKQVGSVNYYQKGTNPKILIHCGTHGDEYRSITPLTNYVLENHENLNDFIFVPEVSPTAVQQKTRTNENNIDLNRNYFSDTNENEIIHNLEIIKDHKFDLTLLFHEDPEYSEFYFYDSKQLPKSVWSNFVNELKSINIDVLNGIDDPKDPDLGFEFENGYFSFNHLNADGSSGSCSDFLLTNEKTKRAVIIEIPSNSTEQQKEQIISLIFSHLLPNL